MELASLPTKAPIAKRVKAVIGYAAARVGVFAWDFRSKMTIVTFHRVRDDMPEDGLTCKSAKFEKFCKFFRAHFRVISLAEQVAGCSAAKDMGGTLSITFDDGYRDNFEVAAPILRKLGLPATFFVVTGFVGTRTVAFWDRNLPRQPGWMDWDQLRELTAQGFDIGSHTDTHVDLGTADEETTRLELETSKRKLDERLGKPVRLFAYPFGMPDNISKRAREQVRQTGFACCISAAGGANPPITSPFELTRIVVGSGYAIPEQFGLDLVIGRV
jgi:peptidoglycan/xylan/chitin deacetylase (PgdA/CDA1 family)